MKKTKINLLFFASIFAISAPTITMSSCASVSQWLIPVTTGMDINKSMNGLQNARDHAGNEIINYTPESYIYSSAISNDTMHVFCEPTDSEDSAKSLSKQYYSVSNNEIKTVNTTDKENPEKIFKNINLLQMSNGVLSVANNLTHLYSFVLAYQSWIGMFNKEKMASLYGIIDPDDVGLSSLYQKGQQNNIDFFEFYFSFNNLLSEGKSGIKFDASNSNFKFKNFSYDNGTEPFSYGPIANSNIEEKFVGKIKRLHESKPEEIGYPLIPNKPEENYGYDDHVILSEVKDKGGVDEKTVAPGIIKQIPIPISNIEMLLSFYNPLEAKSFLPNNWLINDKGTINKKISDSQSWKKFEQYTGSKPEVKNVSWNLNCSVNSNTSMGTGIWPTNSDSIFKMYQDELSYSDFIVLANYSITGEKAKDVDKPANIDRSMIFSGISGIYPAFFFTDEKSFIKNEVTVPGLEKKLDRYFADKEYLDGRIKKLNSALTQHKEADDLNKLFQYSFKNLSSVFNLSDFLKRWY